MGNNLNGLFRLAPVLIGLLVVAGFAAHGCHEGPFGRSQLITISPEQEMQLGRQAYQQVLSKERGHIVQDGAVVEAVREVGNRLRKAAEDPEIRKLLDVNSELKFEWQFNVIRSNQINAFCLPGGKVVVYTGILPVCETEAGLAVVLGHEIGHALARHGAERMSQQKIYSIAQAALATSLGGLDPQKQQMILGMFGAGANVGVLLPFSRTHESEADHIGLVLMAAAGYDPNQALSFWKRMEERTNGGGPEYLSTHPSHDTRIGDIENKWLGEAERIYKNSAKAPHPDMRLPLPEQSSTSLPKMTPKEHVPAKGPGWEIK